MMASRLLVETPKGVTGNRRKKVQHPMKYVNGEWQKNIHLYLCDPNKITTPHRVISHDSSVQHNIAELEEALAVLKQYRLDLMERYRYLYETPTAVELVLQRERSFRSSYVTYRLILCKTYPDGTTHTEQISTYPGKERKQAFSEYEAYCKSHPGISHRLDIEKAKWEK